MATAWEPENQDGPGSTSRRILFFATWGSILLFGLVLVRAVLLPFFLGLVLAYVLSPIVVRMQRVMPRWVAIVILYSALLGILSAGAVFAVPRLAIEVQKLARDAPGIVDQIRNQWLPSLSTQLRHYVGDVRVETESTRPPSKPQLERSALHVRPDGSGGFYVELPDGGVRIDSVGRDGYRVGSAAPARTGEKNLAAVVTSAVERALFETEATASAVVKTVQRFVQAVIRGVFAFFLMLMVSAYLLGTSDRIFGFFRRLVRPTHREQFDRLLARVDRGLSGVVRGQLVIAAVNGVLSGIGFYILDLKYWPVLTLIATLLSIIPIFGAILSTVPAVFIALGDGFGTALLTLAWIVGIHQLEANVFNPKIMGDAAKVHPVLVILALLAGEHLYGIAGALLAVPILSITQSLFLHFRDLALGPDARVPADSSFPPAA